MAKLQKITPCLWFDKEGEEAAKFYTSVFPNSRITGVSRYGEFGKEAGGEPGSVMTVTFELDGYALLALNGGPHFKFTEAISLTVYCDTQEEIDYYWDRLSEGGAPNVCGWLKDKFGLSWQVVPSVIPGMLVDRDPAKVQRVMEVVMRSKKLDVAEIEGAYKG